ncbi:hypothetical protein [Stieleria marina]
MACDDFQKSIEAAIRLGFNVTIGAVHVAGNELIADFCTHTLTSTTDTS